MDEDKEVGHNARNCSEKTQSSEKNISNSAGNAEINILKDMHDLKLGKTPKFKINRPCIAISPVSTTIGYIGGEGYGWKLEG